MPDYSPMMEQYFRIKAENPDAILFFRLGDFYEMFFDDAKLASRELELTLTGRDCGQEERAPMCGVPFHSSEAYIARLVAKGYKVAVCEQTEDPALAKGLVKRDIIRVVTPGTVTESSMLDEGKNNYLAVVFVGEGETGMCFADVSTAQVYITVKPEKSTAEQLCDELSRFMPREIIFNDAALKHYPGVVSFAHDRLNSLCEFHSDTRFDPEKASAYICHQFKIKSLSEMDLEEDSVATISLGAALTYLSETRCSDVKNISKINKYTDNLFMGIDLAARRNLEIFETLHNGSKKGSLLWVLDRTKTAMGRRMLRFWLEQPLLSPAAITRRQSAVGEFFENTVVCGELSENLSGIFDIQRILTRVIYNTATPPEMLSLAGTISHIPDIRKIISPLKSSLIREIYNNTDELTDVMELIYSAVDPEAPSIIRDGGIIKEGYSAELDILRGDMNGGKDTFAEIEQRERERTGIKNLRIRYNKVFGYYIEVTNSYKELVPEDYIRKQTLTNCERFITEELKKLETRVLGARESSVRLEQELFDDLRKKVAAQQLRIQTTAESIAQLDTIRSLAEAAIAGGYTCPEIAADGRISITEGRHPMVEAILKQPFVPNDTLLDQSDNRCAIITGPNMAGKSTYMRQVAVITLMAQIGSFVPAKHAHIGIVDRIFTRVGASDDLTGGRSTFMVEMSEVADIIKYATRDSLILLDEIGRGTSTYDGMSIAKAVLEYVACKRTLGAKTLFATHYHELVAMQAEIDGVTNFNVAVKKRGDDITFLHRIVPGGADRSYGIEVAKIAGIPDSVVSRARHILKELESTDTRAPLTGEANKEVQSQQTSFTTRAADDIVDKLKNTDVNTLTPIEALSVLYELSDKARQS